MKVELSQFNLTAQDKKDFKATLSSFKSLEKNPEGSLKGFILKRNEIVKVVAGNKL